MYQPNTNIQIGDIILVRGAPKTSKIIAKRTGGHFSHAMLAIDNGRVIEAIS